MPEIEIRPADIPDIKAICAIEHAYKSSYVWQMDVSQQEGQLAVTFREIRLPRPASVEYPRSPRRMVQDWPESQVVLVGVLSGETVAYIRLSEQVSPGTAGVTDMAVEQRFRRKGIASALVLAAQEWTSRRSLRRMILEMQSKNQPAIRMAQKLGFEFCGYNDHYYANQDIALFFAQQMR
jgi:ribosomal protein S18 acetylase RimI-like enzyme